jgi:hypothetical protein
MLLDAIKSQNIAIDRGPQIAIDIASAIENMKGGALADITGLTAERGGWKLKQLPVML